MKLWARQTSQTSRRLVRRVAKRSLLSGYELYALRQEQLTEMWGLIPSREGNPLTRNPRRYWSQSDEDGILEEIIARVGPQTGGSFLEFGVGDGSECNTLSLLARGWSGAWIGGETLKFSPIPGGRLTFLKDWIDASNVVSLAKRALQVTNCLQPDIVSMDLDGNDYHLTRELLESGLQPRAWVAEYNGRFPVGCQWIMDYDSAHEWALDDYFGASLSSMAVLFEEFDYFPVACSVTGANVFFVQDDFSEDFADVNQDLEALYQPPLYGLVPDWGHEASPKTLRSLTRPI